MDNCRTAECTDSTATDDAITNDTTLNDSNPANFTQGIMVLPIRMVKGLEFDTVILWNPDMKHGLERPDTAKLLYVAATRALHELYVFQC